MGSPFPPSSSAAGVGHLIAELSPQKNSVLSTVTFQYPLKLISPSPSPTQKSALVFLLSYGGGLVGGDQVYLSVTVKESAKLSIVTQGNTKIFKSPSPEIITRQKLHVSIEDGAALCLLPDPVQPFERSVYEQVQVFTVADNGSLCLLDWVSEGRTARGESWELCNWSGRNEVWSAPQPSTPSRLLLRDKVILGAKSVSGQEKTLKTEMHGLHIFGTLVLKGPLVESLAAFFLKEFSALPRIGARDFRSQSMKDKDNTLAMSSQEVWRKHRLQQEVSDGVLWSAAKVRGCTVIKFGARSVESGRTWVGNIIREEGSILKCFGEDAAMCIC